MDERPIGIFDSGLGGLTVVKTVIRELPRENIIYFGDTARMPYGDRSKETLLQFVKQDMEFLLSKGVKAIVVACNTADATAKAEMEKIFDLPVVGVVQPAAFKAVQSTKNKTVGIISTNATANSGAYGRAMNAIDETVRVYTQGCPKLVPLVEAGKFTIEAADTLTALKEYIEPLIQKGIDTLILGCTHYVLLEELIRFLYPGLILISSGLASAETLKNTLKSNGLLNLGEGRGAMRFYVSGSPETFAAHGSMFLGEDIQKKAHKAQLPVLV